MVKERIKKVVLYYETSCMSMKMGKPVVITLANLKNHGKYSFSIEPCHKFCQRLFINFLVKKNRSNFWMKMIRL